MGEAPKALRGGGGRRGDGVRDWLREPERETLRYRCLKKNTPPEKKTHGNISFKNTKSKAGEQFLLRDCKARAHPKGVFLFTDTGRAMDR